MNNNKRENNSKQVEKMFTLREASRERSPTGIQMAPIKKYIVMTWNGEI